MGWERRRGNREIGPRSEHRKGSFQRTRGNASTRVSMPPSEDSSFFSTFFSAFSFFCKWMATG